MGKIGLDKEMDIKQLGTILSTFIIILVGVVLIDNIADSISEIDDTIAIANNDTLTWAGNNTAMSLSYDELVSGTEVVYNNGTKINKGNNYTTNYEQGTITIINQSGDDGIGEQSEWVTDAINASYTYQAEGYIDNATARTIIPLTIIFFAITIILVGYFLVMRSFSGLF